MALVMLRPSGTAREPDYRISGCLFPIIFWSGYRRAEVILEVDDDESGHDVVVMVVSLEVGLLWERLNLWITSIAKPLLGRKHL